MSIVYYPSRVYKGKVPAIDRVMAKRDIRTAIAIQNAASTALDATISANDGWQIDSIAWSFSNTVTRNFDALIANGRKVVVNYNDYLWIWHSSNGPQRIILDAGFYTGTELAAQLQSKLDAQPVYAAASITFTVTYVNATGIFTVTPSSGTIKYLNFNAMESIITMRDSIAGHLFGFTTTDTTFGATITSDVAVVGLDSEMPIVTQTSSSATSYTHIGPEVMSLDQALHLTSNSGADVTITCEVTYEEIV